MTLYDLESKVEKPRRKTIKGNDGFTCRCPSCAARDDDKAGTNGHAYEKDDWLHVGCQKGCTEAEFMAALGLTPEDRKIEPYTPSEDARPPRPRGEKYAYLSPKGAVVFVKERYYVWDDAKGWQKRFSQKTSEGDNVSTLGAEANVLYNRPEVERAKREGLTVYVNEGEKAVEALRLAGLVGTCAKDGAGKGDNLAGKWKPAHTDQLRGVARVVVVADRDDVGLAFAAFVAAQLGAAGIPVEVVQSATLGAKDDAHDHVSAGLGAGDFVSMPTPPEPVDDRLAGLTIFGKEFVAPEVEWIVEDYLLAGKMTLLDGRRGTTKSTMALQWAASFSRGVHPFLTRTEGGRSVPLPLPCGPIRTLYIHKGEDDSAQYEKVYRANGGLDGSIAFLDDVKLKLNDDGLARIRDYIEAFGARYVILDNLIYFLSTVCKSINDADQVAPVILGLTRIASETGAAFHNMRHMRKSGGDKSDAETDMSEAGLGSVIIASIHRGQHVIQKSKDKPGVFVMTCERGTIETAPGDPIGWRKFDLELEYLKSVDDPRDKTNAADRMSQRSKARDLLLGNLTCSFGIASKDLDRVALDMNLSPETLKRAKKDLGVVSMRRPGVPDGRFYLRIPDEFEGDDFDPWATK